MRQLGLAAFLLMPAFVGAAFGQSMVGYGMGAARAVTTAAPAREIGKSLDKAWKSEEKVLKSGETAPAGRSSRTSARKVDTKTKAAPPVNYEDPAKVEAGLTYPELIRRFGPPTMQFTGEGGIRTLTYLRKSSNTEVVLQEGKVGSVNVMRTQQASAAPR